MVVVRGDFLAHLSAGSILNLAGQLRHPRRQLAGAARVKPTDFL